MASGHWSLAGRVNEAPPDHWPSTTSLPLSCLQMINLFILGIISILGQVALLRELNVAFYGVELIYSLALGLWLLCTAAGAWLSRRSSLPLRVRMSLLFGLFSILLPLDAAFIRAIRILFGGVPGAYLPFHAQVLSMSLALLPIGLLLGLLFQRSAASFISGKKSLALAYAAESAGGVVGGLGATLLLRLGVQNLGIVSICSLVSLIPPLAIAIGARQRALAALWSVVVGCLILTCCQIHRLDHATTAWTHPDLVETRDSPYGRLTLTQLHGQTSVFENDELSFNTEGTEAEEFVQLSALQHPGPGRILVLGGGIAGLVYEAQKHKPSQIDYVEIDPALLDVVESHLPIDFSESIHRPNVRIFHTDPRKVPDNAGKYDLILVGMPEPASGQANRFYTKEFYRQCRAWLNPDGVVSFRLASSENYWTPQLRQRTISIYRACKSSFTDVLVLPGSTNIIIGSGNPLPRDPAVLAGRFRQRHIVAKLVSPSYIQYLYSNDRFAEISKILESGNAPINTDSRPICYQYTILLWLSKFFPGITDLDFSEIASRGTRLGAREWLLIAAILALFLLSRRKQRLRRALLVGTAGYLGMVMETLLILNYQVKKGILFQDLGLLLMSFMAGLAAGAAVLDHYVCNWRADSRATTRILGAGLVFSFAPQGAWIAYRISMGAGLGLLETAFLLAASGFLVSGLFGYASLSGESEDARDLIAPLYAADLTGGCVGSFAGTLFFIPVFGLAATSAWMIPVALLATVLV